MDFAAQLAKLERQAAKAKQEGTATNNPNSISSNNNNNNYNNNNNNYNQNNDVTTVGRSSNKSRRYDYNQSSPHHNYNNSNRNHYSNNRHPSPNHRNNQRNNNNYSNTYNNNNNELERNYGYRIRPSPWVPKVDRSRPHICLLAIIIDELPYEHIWKAWCNTNNNNTTTNNTGCYVSLVCHAKYPHKVQSKWVQERLLVQPPQKGRGTTYDPPIYYTLIPDWGSIQITRAMISCLQDALLIGTNRAYTITDHRFTPNRYVIHTPSSSSNNTNNNNDTTTIPTVDKFIFISESCLPIRTIDEYVNILFYDSIVPDSSVVSHSSLPIEGEVTKSSTIIPPVDEIKLETSISTSSTVNNDESAITSTNNDSIQITNNNNNQKVDVWDVSWINARNCNTIGTPKNMYERNQFTAIERCIPNHCRYKSDQWILLSRKHAVAIVHIDEHYFNHHYNNNSTTTMTTSYSQNKNKGQPLWTLFRKIGASDEMYFPTAMGILGFITDDEVNGTKAPVTTAATTATTETITATPIDTTATAIANTTTINPIVNDDIKKHTAVPTKQQQSQHQVLYRSVTYTDWSQGMRNPTSYSKGIVDFEMVACIAREQHCLLARKFVIGQHNTATGTNGSTGQITVDEWLSVMNKFAGVGK